MDTSTNLPPETPSKPEKFWTRLKMKVTGIDEEVMRQCPEADKESARRLGEIALLTWIYLSAVFSLIGWHLFGAKVGAVVIIIGAVFLGSYISWVDCYAVLHGSWFAAGTAQLQRGGFDISGGPIERAKRAVYLAIRIPLSVGLAQLTAIFIALLVFADDISARLNEAFVTNNGRLLAHATEVVDATIKREADAVSNQTKRVEVLAAQLAALRQKVIDPAGGDPQFQQAQDELSQLLKEKTKADQDLVSFEAYAASELAGIKATAANSGRPGSGVRYKAAAEQVANAKARALELETRVAAARQRFDDLRTHKAVETEATKNGATAQLAAFEVTSREEAAKLETAKRGLADLTASREAAIRKAVENAPDHVAQESGFLAQILALDSISKQNEKIAIVIILIDVVAWGLDLATILAKVLCPIPTSYALFVARDAFMHAARAANEISIELQAMDEGEQLSDGTPRPPDPFGSPHVSPAPTSPTTDALAEPQPMKRGRGRPRKYPLPGLKSPNGQVVQLIPRGPSNPA